MWRRLLSLVMKDFKMLVAGKFPIVAIGSLLLYTLFVNFGYIGFMEAEPYRVYLNDPTGSLVERSDQVVLVHSSEELAQALSADANGVGVDAGSGELRVVLYKGSEKADSHRKDYALSLLLPGEESEADVVGRNTPEMKQRREITCELLFIELIAVGFLGVASVLFKEKQMGVIRIHATLPLEKGLFVLSKIAVFLICDLVFAALLTAFSIEAAGAADVLPSVLVQVAILSPTMSLIAFACSMLLRDFKQFSLAYLAIAAFVVTPVFLAANTPVELPWVGFHPFYRLYIGLKGAYFGEPITDIAYYACTLLAVGMLYLVVWGSFCREARREG